jgi:hypothetical protein
LVKNVLSKLISSGLKSSGNAGGVIVLSFGFQPPPIGAGMFILCLSAEPKTCTVLPPVFPSFAKLAHITGDEYAPHF